MDFIDKLLDGTASAGATFLVIGVVCVVLLVVSVALGGIFEFFHFGDGPLSLTTIAAFGSIFGFVGYAAIGGGATAQMATLFGSVAGLIGGILSFLAMRFLKNSDSTGSIETTSLVGTDAVVILRIPGGDNHGEVAVTRYGARHTFSAISREPIPTGTNVTIVSTITSSSVLVEKKEELLKNEAIN